MSSNIDLEFEDRMSVYFTAAELVEFLGLEVEDILSRFDDVVEEHYRELLIEIS